LCWVGCVVWLVICLSSSSFRTTSSSASDSSTVCAIFFRMTAMSLSCRAVSMAWSAPTGMFDTKVSLSSFFKILSTELSRASFSSLLPILIIWK
jgi:hypothetical protein